MVWILRKIIVDDPGKTGNGSDAKIHSEITFQGNEQDMRTKIAELNITNQYVVANSEMNILKKFSGDKGYLLYSKKGGIKMDKELMKKFRKSIESQHYWNFYEICHYNKFWYIFNLWDMLFTNDMVDWYKRHRIKKKSFMKMVCRGDAGEEYE